MNRALILAAHGSESSAGRSSFARLLNAVRREAGDLQVHGSFVDVQEPLVASVLADTTGPRAVVPLMLCTDALARSAVLEPALMEPDVRVSPMLGPNWVLAEIGVQRLIEAGARSDDSILLAADAVDDRRGAADVGRAARLISAVWGGRVHVGMLGGPDAALSEAIDIARAYGYRPGAPRRGRVIVSSYLLGDGAAQAQLRAVAADVVTEPLLSTDHPDPHLVSLILTLGRSRSIAPPQESLVSRRGVRAKSHRVV